MRPPIERITLHECRHTYASFLMVAGYTLKEIMEYMGHSNLAMVQRYVKLLPQPEETDPAERLNAYLPAGRPADINRARVSTFVSTQRRRMLVL